MKDKTAFSDTAADAKSRLNMRKEGLFDLIIEKESDLKEGPYIGYIVEAQKIKGGQIKAYIRIPEIHDFIVPSGCQKAYTESQNKALKSMLITALSTTDSNNDNENTDMESYRGKEVEITFLNGTPKQKGKMRGASMRILSSTINLDAQFCYLEAGANQQLLNPEFYKTNSKLLVDVEGKVSKGMILKGRLNLTWQELKKLGKENIFKELFDNIAGAESGGSYDAYNRGSCSDCGGIGQDPIIKAYGAKLSELPIVAVTDKLMKDKKIGGRSVFATGKYQMVPETLRTAIERIQGCDTNELYGPEQQEAFGCWLILEKRPRLGRYLLGDKKVSLETAQLDLAKEWAGMRVAGNHTRPEVKKYKNKKLVVWRKETKLKLGEAYYKDYDNWAVGADGKAISPTNPAPKKDSNPDGVDEDKAKKTSKVLAATRESLKNNKVAQQIAKKL